MPRRRGGLSGGVGDVVAGRSDEAATGEEVGELGSALTVIGDDRAGGARGCRGYVDGAHARGAQSDGSTYVGTPVTPYCLNSAGLIRRDTCSRPQVFAAVSRQVGSFCSTR